MKKKIFKKLIIVSIVIISLGLRFHAANTLQIDHDEPVYLDAALEYTNYLRNGELKGLAWSDTNFEHPSLYKIIYGVFLLSQNPLEELHEKDFRRLEPIQTADGKPWGMVGRWVSTFFGGISISIVTIMNPLAGLFLGINTVSIKYTSIFYLESLPLLSSLLTGVFYLTWLKRKKQQFTKKNLIWLGLSAISLGITAASKYVYCVVGGAIVIHFLVNMLRKKIEPSSIALLFAWGGVALFTFFIFNPFLWPHPIERIVQSLTFHTNYPMSNIVKQRNYPFWQPFLWLSTPFSTFFPATRSSFIIRLDLAISLLALAGIPRLIKHHQLFFIWLMTGLTILLVWPTKWPQYTLIIMIPFCFSAAEGARWLYNLVISRRFLP